MKPSPKLTAILRWLLLGLAVLATLATVFVAVENWRGDRAWAAVESELKARGERLDFAGFQPPPVPDEQNLFKAPLLARILYKRPDDADRKKLLSESRLMGFYELGKYPSVLKDFSALRDSLKKAGVLSAPYTDSPAADVLHAMQPMQPLLDDLREAARYRPKAALERSATPLERPLIEADVAFYLAQALSVRASAEVTLGRIDDAYADIFALQRFANALSEHPATLLNLLVGVAMQGLAASAISDGCQRHIWSEPRLAEFQNLLDELHPLAGFRETLYMERAGSIYLFDSRSKIAFGKGLWPRWLFHGWAQQNKVAYCRRLESEALSQFSSDPDRISSELSARASKPSAAPTKYYSPYEWLPRMALTNIGRILIKLGTTADQLKLASVSLAIERYRIARGRYPETLDELAPTFLPAVPNGIFDGQPVRYTKLSPGGHQLYSVGQNGRDDGGKDDDIVVKLPDSS